MNGYRSNMDLREAPAEGCSVRTIELSSAFVPSLAPPYPNIEDELRKDVAILRSSLEVRDRYIREIREGRDSLQAELNDKEAYISSLKDSLEDYKGFHAITTLKRFQAKADNSD